MPKYSFTDLLGAAQDLSELIPEDVASAVRRLGLDVDALTIAGASLGAPLESVDRLCELGMLPDLMPTAVKERLAQELGVECDALRPAIRQNKEVVAEFLGFAVSQSGPAPLLPNLAAARYPLFPHQRKALQQILGLLELDNDRIVLHMPTGGGKTRTAMNLVCDRLRRNERGAVLWVASTKELLAQAVIEFERTWSYLGNRNVPVVCAWEGRKWSANGINDGVLVASLATLYKFFQRKGVLGLDELGRRLQLIVFDEAHQAIAPTYREVVERLSSAGEPLTPIIGLTATPGRTFLGNHEDDKLSDFFKHKKIMLDTSAEGGSSNPVEYLVEHGYLADAEFELIGDVQEDSTPPTFESDEEQELALGLQVEAYVDLVVTQAFEMVKAGHARIIVFAASVDLARTISRILRAAGINAQSVDGTTDSSTRDAVIRQFTTRTADPRVLVNYGVLTTGFDAPQVSAAIIARPTRSLVLYSQMVGRAIRGPKAGGNERAKVATVVDPTVPAFGNIANAFAHWNEYWE